MKKKAGRRGKYDKWVTDDGLLKLQGWARDGLTDDQIADNIGINRTTLYAWENRFPDIRDALKRGKEVVDRQVENALLKRALGYEYDEVTHEPDKDTGQLVVSKVVRKQVIPDTTAQIFWLKNRKPDEFRDKRDVELSGNVDFSSVIAQARERAKNAEAADEQH